MLNKEDAKKKGKTGIGVNGNLVPCTKGEVRNPNGRNGSRGCISDILRKIGDEKFAENSLVPDSLKEKFVGLAKSTSNIQALMHLVYVYALRGEAWAVQYITERTEGKAPEQPIVERKYTIVSVKSTAYKVIDDKGNERINAAAK